MRNSLLCLLAFCWLFPFYAFSQSASADSLANQVDSTYRKKISQADYEEIKMDFLKTSDTSLKEQDLDDSLQHILFAARVLGFIKSTHPALANGYTAEDLVNYAQSLKDSISVPKLSNSQAIPIAFSRGDTLFTLYGPMGDVSPRERQILVNQRLRKLLSKSGLDPAKVGVFRAPLGYVVKYDSLQLFTVTQEDAQMNEAPARLLALQFSEEISDRILDRNTGFNSHILFVRLGLIAATIITIFLLILFINWLYRRGLVWLDQFKEKAKPLAFRHVEFLGTERQITVLKIGLNILRFLLLLVAIYFTIPILFSFFPETKGYARILFDYALHPFSRMLRDVFQFVPNLITILVVGFLFYYVIHFLRLVYYEIQRGRIVIRGFYKEWALTTFHIVRILVIILALVIIYPLIPGSGSMIFNIILLFLGILILLGSITAVRNLISGIVVTYMRPFVLGDKIKIKEYAGTVVQRNLLVTWIVTDNQEDVAIPNTELLSAPIKNYSRNQQGRGLVVFARIKVDFREPAEKVKKLLSDAANKTEGIAAQPVPTSVLKDIQGSGALYEVKANISDATQLEGIKSRLMTNVLLLCQEEKIALID